MKALTITATIVALAVSSCFLTEKDPFARCSVVMEKEFLLDSRDFPIEVDYDLPLEKMIEAGHFDCAFSEWINEKNFRKAKGGKVKVNVKLVSPKFSWFNIEEVLAELEKNNLRPATLEELLAFGATYPEEQKKNQILALGSISQDPVNLYGLCSPGTYAPYLTSFTSNDASLTKEEREKLRRMLGLWPLDKQSLWSLDWCFAAVPLP